MVREKYLELEEEYERQEGHARPLEIFQRIGS